MQTEAFASDENKTPPNDRGITLGDRQSVAPPSQNGPLEWWYRLAAPLEPQQSTSEDRERVRAGRLSSVMLLIMFCFGITQLPNAFMSTNHFFLFIVLIAMVIDAGAFILNRRGQVLLAGSTMVVVVEIAFILVVLTSRTGITARSLTIFHLIVLTELMAVSLLPGKSVFIVALCNTIFTWAAISFLPHAPDFKLVTTSAYYSALASPIVLQVIVAIVTYLWAEGTRQAIARAEQVAVLERALAERDRAAAEQKLQLEQGIQQILHTHVQAANGNFEARAPLTQDNVLWQVGYGLNNLLARLQRAIQSENELQRAEKEVGRLLGAVRNAKAKHQLFQASRSGTILDPLAQELTGTRIHQP
ncbi:hypothetical protein [Dictyobacter alpinus]|nr:hypothetical protein [Dictyobacter alpinus]